MLEQEAKFWVPDLAAFRSMLEDRGARLLAPRVWEYNIRFDTPDRALQAARQVLRLRRDRKQTLAYKGRPRLEGGVVVREEIEVEIDDLEAARRLLKALGFVEVFVYEKYRTLYRWGEVVLALDETPMGNFVEVEGPSAQAVQAAARQLGLDPSAAVADSYAGLFHRLKAHYRWPFRDLTFANFPPTRPVDLGVLGLRPAWGERGRQ